jgi:hypothetical protein
MSDFTESAVVHTELNDTNDARTWVLDGHLATKPQVVIQKRRTTGPSNDQKLESELKVVFGTTDAADEILPTKISISCSSRYSVFSASADIDAAIAEFQLLVAADGFADMIKKQLYYG